MANNETRTLKTNTFEDWRQKTNEQSFELGDVDQLDSRILDKNYTYTAAADQGEFTGAGTGGKTLRFEQAPDVSTDILHTVIFSALSAVPSNFVAGATCTQSGGFSGKILWINKGKAAFSTVSGTFNAGQNLVQGAQNIPHANLVRTISESVKVGYVRVKVQGTEISQSQIQAGFHVPNYGLKVSLSGSPTIPATFTEGVTLTQSGGFSGTLLSASTTELRFKTGFTGSFNTGTLVQFDGSDRILAANLNSLEVQDTTYENIVELHTLASASNAIIVIANSAVDAVNEVQDDIGDITTLGTTDKSDIVTAINELETAARGSTANYTISTTSNDLVGAINEHDAELGTISAVAMGTTASTVGPAILELETEIDVLNARVEPTQAFAGTFSSSTVMDALNEHETDIGNMTLTGLAASDISAGLREIRVDIGNVGNSGATLTTGTSLVATDLTAAVVELDATLGSGVIAGSGTEAVGAGNITTAVNLLNTAIGDADSYNDGTYGATTIAGTLDLLQAGMIANDTEIANRLKLNLDSTTQVLTGTNRTIQIGDGTDAVTLDFAANTTLDLSDGTLLLSAGGGVANFGSAFLNLDANLSTGMGLQVDRDHISQFSTMTNHDVRLQWNEAIAHNGSALINPEEAWQLIGMETDGTTNTTSIVTRYNAYNLIANNTESGIAVTWDATNENFDFVVANSDFALTGDVTGSVTQTAKGNVSIATTIAANSVALGTDTSGAYVTTIAGTANEITVAGSGAETAAVTISLPDDVTIGNDLVVTDYTRTAGLRVGTSGSDPGDGNLAIAGNATIAGNTTITGNLTVNGTQTTLNTATLEVEDTLVLAGNDLTSEPATGGFGVEVGPIITQTVNGAVSSSTSVTLDSGTGVIVGQGVYGTGVASNATVAGISGTTLTLSAASSIADGATLSFSHPTRASNVTGSHSIVYNYATDQWEADGSLVLSNATNTPPTIESTSFGANKNLDFVNGGGITATTTSSGNTITTTFGNTDRGSSQLFYRQFTSDSGTATATANNDSIDIEGGTAISTSGSTDKITISHADTSTQASVDNANGNVIQDVTLDTHGHVTGLASTDLDGRYYRENEFASANTASKPVIRDGSGNFSAGTITANLTGTASQAANAGTLDSLDSTAFLRSNAADTFTSKITMGTQIALEAGDYGTGVFGKYSDTKYQHVWGMGNAYPMHASGNNLTGFYGMAWTHSNVGTTYASGHQMLIVTNGTVTSAIGDNLWTTGIVTASGGTSTNWNAAYTDTNGATSANTASKIVERNASGDFTAGTITAALSGNASSATYATKVTFNQQGNTNTTLKLLLGDPSNSTVTQGTVYKDSALTFNCSSNTLSADIFSGALSGNATSSTQSLVTQTSVNENYFLTFSSKGTGNVDLRCDSENGQATYNPGTNTLTAANFVGSLNGTASSVSGQGNSATLTAVSTNTANNIVLRDASGNFSAGTITASLTGNVSGSSGTCTGAAGSVPVTGVSTNAALGVLFHSGGAIQVDANGPSFSYNPSTNNLVVGNNINCVDVIASSDMRLKTKVGTIDNALDKVCALDGFLYTWNDKAPSKDKETVHAGVSAQQVQEVLPEAVDEGDNGYLGVKYDKLVPLLIESIKELKAEVEELKSINR